MIICALVSFGLSAETNDSRLMWIPRREFVRVIRGIIVGSSEQNGENVVENYVPIKETPRSAALRRARALAPTDAYGKTQSVKRDSFYFLQRTLESRSRSRNVGVDYEERDTPRAVDDNPNPSKWTPRTKLDKLM